MPVRPVVAFLWLCLTAAVLPAAGQPAAVPAPDPSLRRDTLAAGAPQPYVLEPFIRAGSEAVFAGGVRLDTAAYRIDYRFGRLWVDAVPPDGVLVVEYRTWPFRFKDVYRRPGSVLVARADSAAVVDGGVPADGTGPRDPFGNARLQRSGSITRGILAGNNRDVSVESGLRMQLSGEVLEGVNLQAVLTDENTPIQPEGTTQRLSDFDRVYIALEAPQGTAQLGDFDLTLRGTEFARFSRKLQGVALQSEWAAPAAPVLAGGRVVVAGAAARGLFRTQEIEPIDGVQGPYRLEGKEGEQFIIVVAGSEQVYLDGVLLTRGETNDYVIDYATGELTFTPRRIITDDRRLLVEFQYTTNAFTRTLVATQAEAALWPGTAGRPRLTVGSTFLREADQRQFNAELGFTPADSLLLVGAGDGPAARSGGERVAFDPEAPYVQYVREPRLGPDGGVDTVFVALSARPDPSTPVYRVRFTRRGPGAGSYARVGRAVNGILYEYRGPGLGEYTPERLLPRPRRQRLVDLHGTAEPVAGLAVFGEWARSLNDENRLSPLGDDDDVDDAYLAGVRLQPLPLHLGRLDVGMLSAEVRRRYTGAHFAAFDRIRPVEFERRWNLVSRDLSPGPGDLPGGREAVDEARLQLDFSPRSSAQGEFGRIDLGTRFEGSRRAAFVKVAEPGLPLVDYLLEHIRSQDALTQEAGAWLRQRAVLAQPWHGGRLVSTLEVEQERRRQRVLGTDSLARSSFAFVEVRPGLAWAGDKLEAGGEVELRREQDWAAGTLRDAATAWTLQSNLKLRASRTFSTEATAGYRLRRFTDYFRVHERRENGGSAVINLNSRWLPLDRAVEANLFYEALTERTPTLQEIYVRTGPELGQFVWEDANADGLLQVDEFIPERTPNEGAYVKTFIPSDSLIAVVGVQARLRVGLEPGRLWRDGGDGAWQRLLAGVSTRTTVEVQEKSRAPDLWRLYTLDPGYLRQPGATLNGRLRLAQEVYLFRNRQEYGMEVVFNQVRGLAELAAGQEERFLNTWRAEGRYRPNDAWGVRLAAAQERNRVASAAFASRRYDIAGVSVAPEVAYNPTRSLQLTGGFAYARKRDAVEARRATILRLPVEARYVVLRKLQLTARGEVARVVLRGTAVGLAQYELTDGRGPGTSLLWHVSGQYTLNQYLRAALTYDGRAPSGAPVLHTMRLQLSAVF